MCGKAAFLFNGWALFLQAPVQFDQLLGKDASGFRHGKLILCVDQRQTGQQAVFAVDLFLDQIKMGVVRLQVFFVSPFDSGLSLGEIAAFCVLNRFEEIAFRRAAE